MVTNRFVNPEARPLPAPLAMLLYAIAQESADEETGGPSDELWAGLLRDGADIADRARELIQADAVDDGVTELESSAWAQVENSAGVIVTKDVQGRISVQTFRSEEDLMSAWNALEAELEPFELGSPRVRSPESDDTPA